jgi:hypothetical protein
MGNGICAPINCAVWACAAALNAHKKASKHAAVETLLKLRFDTTENATVDPRLRHGLPQIGTFSGAF